MIHPLLIGEIECLKSADFESAHQLLALSFHLDMSILKVLIFYFEVRLCAPVYLKSHLHLKNFKMLSVCKTVAL